MKKFILYVVLVSLFFCTGKVFMEKADAQMNFFFEALTKQDFEKSLEFVSKAGFEHSTREQWLGLMLSNLKNRGQLKKWKLVGRVENGLSSDRRIDLVYKVFYEKGDFDELVALEKQEGVEYIRLIGYNSDYQRVVE